MTIERIEQRASRPEGRRVLDRMAILELSRLLVGRLRPTTLSVDLLV